MICQLLLVCLTGFPQPRIAGPTQVPCGDLAILTVVSGDSLSVAGLTNPPPDHGDANPFDGLATQWLLLDSNKQFSNRPSDHGPRIEFFTGTEGTYTFAFFCSDGARIAFAKHVLTVGGKPEPSPDNPDPKPVPSRFGVTEQARLWIQSVPTPERPRAKSFAAQCTAIAATILTDKQVRQPQELLDDMVDAANALETGWSEFRAKLKQYTEQTIAQKRFASAQDVAVYLQELAKGISE